MQALHLRMSTLEQYDAAKPADIQRHIADHTQLMTLRQHILEYHIGAGSNSAEQRADEPAQRSPFSGAQKFIENHDHAAGLEHTFGLGQRALGIRHYGKDQVHDDCVELCVLVRQAHGVALVQNNVPANVRSTQARTLKHGMSQVDAGVMRHWREVRNVETGADAINENILAAHIA